jgi:hypothetical protein
MAVKPWYKVITPREDLRDGRPLDASEFAVHLDHVRDGRAPEDYKNPERFFDRTFLTVSLIELGGGVIRRLAGHKVETSAIYNLTTQFGGGKTHALTLLYHLAAAGPTALKWKGVRFLLEKAGVQSVPAAATPSSIPFRGVAARMAHHFAGRRGARLLTNWVKRRDSLRSPSTTKKGSRRPQRSFVSFCQRINLRLSSWMSCSII